MLEILARILALDWRRQGAVFCALAIDGRRVWYADFACTRRPAGTGERASGGPRRRRPAGPPTLVLLHGLGASAASFHPVIAPLRRVFRIVIPDLPGCGRSQLADGCPFPTFAETVDAIEQLVERVAPDGAYVAGNSMGGWIATKLAARRPDLVRGIALLNPGGPALHAEDWADFTAVIGGDGPSAAQRLLERLFHRPPLGSQLFARDLGRIMRGPSVVSLLTSLTAEDFLTDEDMRAVRCPAVLVWGEDDRLIPDGCRSFFLEKLPAVRYEPVPDCGHCPQLECPERTAELLAELPRMRVALAMA